MNKLFQKAWWYYFFGMLGISFLLCYPFFILALSARNGFDRAHEMRKVLTRFFLKCMGIRVKPVERTFSDLSRPHIICSNHCSDLDILILLATLPGRYAFLGKQELAEVPLFGRFFSQMDIPVNRSNAQQSSTSFRQSIQNLKAGCSLVIFPEGGIFRNIPELSPFLNGAFELSSRTKTPILPITINESWKRVHPFQKLGSPGKVEVIFHPVLESSEQTADTLKQKVFNVIQTAGKTQ